MHVQTSQEQEWGAMGGHSPLFLFCPGAGDTPPPPQDYLKCPGGSWSSEVLFKAIGGQSTQRKF